MGYNLDSEKSAGWFCKKKNPLRKYIMSIVLPVRRLVSQKLTYTNGLIVKIILAEVRNLAEVFCLRLWKLGDFEKWYFFPEGVVEKCSEL